MNRQYYEKVFSTQRMEKYFNKYTNDEEKAIAHYHINIEVSEGFYSSLSMLEVSLRNSLNRELIEYYGSDWYLELEQFPEYTKLSKDIATAKTHITSRQEIITSNKVIAELTLGFWVRLLNSEYELTLWKHLRKAFPFVDKKDKQRHKISAPINNIRKFRNRIFHHEPISWNLDKLEEIHNTIFKVMHWLNEDLPAIANKYDRIPEIIEKARKEI